MNPPKDNPRDAGPEADPPTWASPPPPRGAKADPTPEGTTVDPTPPTTTRPGPEDRAEGMGEGPTSSSSQTTTSGSYTPPSTSPTAADTFKLPIATLVGMGGMVVHWRLAPRDVDSDLWLPTTDEVEAIADPLARIAARHSPVSGEDATDLSDGLAALLGGGAYVMRNAQVAREYRRARQGAGEGPVVVPAGGAEPPESPLRSEPHPAA